MAADFESAHDQNQPQHERLSVREFQIFGKLAAGAGVGNIAEELSLSVKTVSTYRSRILEKMKFQQQRIWRTPMPHKSIHPSNPAPNKNLKEDGLTNPIDGRGPLRKSDDSSTKLPLHTGAPKSPRPH